VVKRSDSLISVVLIQQAMRGDEDFFSQNKNIIGVKYFILLDVPILKYFMILKKRGQGRNQKRSVGMYGLRK
jgi:hypothetical protein